MLRSLLFLCVCLASKMEAGSSCASSSETDVCGASSAGQHGGGRRLRLALSVLDRCGENDVEKTVCDHLVGAVKSLRLRGSFERISALLRGWKTALETRGGAMCSAEDLNKHCRDAYRSLIDAFRDVLGLFCGSIGDTVDFFPRLSEGEISADKRTTNLGSLEKVIVWDNGAIAGCRDGYREAARGLLVLGREIRADLLRHMAENPGLGWEGLIVEKERLVGRRVSCRDGVLSRQILENRQKISALMLGYLGGDGRWGAFVEGVGPVLEYRLLDENDEDEGGDRFLDVLKELVVFLMKHVKGRHKVEEGRALFKRDLNFLKFLERERKGRQKFARMDELAALRMIFGRELVETGDLVVISSQGRVHRVWRDTMRVVDATCGYADVYDYIAGGGGAGPSAGARTAEVETLVCDVDRITEEQFRRWKDGQVSEEERRGPSGREIWLERSGAEGDLAD